MGYYLFGELYKQSGPARLFCFSGNNQYENILKAHGIWALFSYDQIKNDTKKFEGNS